MNDKDEGLIKELVEYVCKIHNAGLSVDDPIRLDSGDKKMVSYAIEGILSRHPAPAEVEPLAVLADRKGYWLEIRNFNKEYGWGIYIKRSVPRGPFQTQELEKDLLTDKNYYDYAAAEAKAKSYLTSLPDKK